MKKHATFYMLHATIMAYGTRTKNIIRTGKKREVS